MRTESQQNASRVNGSKSHGPVTPDGKERSSRNATTHGIFSEAVLLKPENRQAWHNLAGVLTRRFKPGDEVETGVVYDMAVATWRKERAIAMEAALINMHFDVLIETDGPARSPDDEMRRMAVAFADAVGRHKAMLELGRIIIRLTNLWIRLHKKLKELQADRKAEEAEIEAENVENEPGAPQVERNQQNAEPKPELRTEPVAGNSAPEPDAGPRKPDPVS